MRPMDPLEVRFLREHCWGRIKAKENQKSCKANGVAVLKIDSGLLEVKGTQAGKEEMIMFLLKLAGQLDCKVRIFGRILFVQSENNLEIKGLLVCSFSPWDVFTVIIHYLN